MKRSMSSSYRDPNRCSWKVGVLGVLAAFALLAAACGIPDDEGARVIAASEAPFDPDPPPSTTTTVPEDLSEDVQIWLMTPSQNDEHKKVAPVTRGVRRGADGITLQKAIELLLSTEADPDSESEADLFNAIPTDTRLADSVVYNPDTNVAIVDLTGRRLDNSKAVAEFLRDISAQLVFTLSTLTVTEVGDRGPIGLRLRIDGEDARVTSEQVGASGAGGQDGPVRRPDYCPYDPEVPECIDPTPPATAPPTTTTTTTSTPATTTPPNNQNQNNQNSGNQNQNQNSGNQSQNQNSGDQNQNNQNSGNNRQQTPPSVTTNPGPTTTAG